MNIDWAVVIEKVPEVVMVLLFIWFSFKKDTSFENFLKARDAIFFKQLETVGSVHNKEIELLSRDLQKQTDVLTKVVDQMSDHTDLLKAIVEDAKRRRAA